MLEEKYVVVRAAQCASLPAFAGIPSKDTMPPNKGNREETRDALTRPSSQVYRPRAGHGIQCSNWYVAPSRGGLDPQFKINLDLQLTGSLCAGISFVITKKVPSRPPSLHSPFRTNSKDKSNGRSLTLLLVSVGSHASRRTTRVRRRWLRIS